MSAAKGNPQASKAELALPLRVKQLHDALYRCEVLKSTVRHRIMREAETAIGMPYHGCVWHNASLSFRTKTQWAEWTEKQEKAYRRMLWQERTEWERVNKLSRALYERYIAATRLGDAAARSGGAK
jgi:4-hydroxy-L-threonine phosphate dehydrogenase PdxA